MTPNEAKSQEVIRYVALGDSYTIGTGATPQSSWPALMTKNLKEEGINIELVANLGQSGWTTEQVIHFQVPVLNKLKPTFVTLLIGTNDWVQGVDSQTYRKNLHQVINEVLEYVPKERFILLSIPDFSKTPGGVEYSHGRDISKSLAEFNQIISDEAKEHNLQVIDLYPLSQEKALESGYVADDGLHPSAQGYATWEKFIRPQIKKILAL